MPLSVIYSIMPASCASAGSSGIVAPRFSSLLTRKVASFNRAIVSSSCAIFGKPNKSAKPKTIENTTWVLGLTIGRTQTRIELGKRSRRALLNDCFHIGGTRLKLDVRVRRWFSYRTFPKLSFSIFKRSHRTPVILNFNAFFLLILIRVFFDRLRGCFKRICRFLSNTQPMFFSILTRSLPKQFYSQPTKPCIIDNLVLSTTCVLISASKMMSTTSMVTRMYCGRGCRQRTHSHPTKYKLHTTAP